MHKRLAFALVLALSSFALANEDVESRARAHSDAGQGLYRLGDYYGALQQFAQGYELSHLPGFLINLGQTYRKLGDAANAAEMFRRFLYEAPVDDTRRAAVESTLRELDAAAAPPEAKPSPPSSPSPVSPKVASANAPAGEVRKSARRRLRPLGIAGIVVDAVGLALLGGGLGAALAADQVARDLNRLDQTGGTFDPNKDRQYSIDRAAEYSCLTLGGVSLVGGTILVALGSR
jgi:tetratricopeptide (TPR) repeat protein